MEYAILAVEKSTVVNSGNNDPVLVSSPNLQRSLLYLPSVSSHLQFLAMSAVQKPKFN